MKKIYFLVLVLFPFVLHAQQITLHGTVKDPQGEMLPYANILAMPDSLLSTSGTDGRFSLTLSAGMKRISISYTGYETLKIRLRLKRDTSFTFSMVPLITELKTVTVSDKRFSQEDLLESTRTGTNLLSRNEITAIPVLGGEADLIKTLQLLPGTVRGVEGSSDLFVRGGAADQNLVLLDGATIYNTSHLFGFLSVFNPDILDGVEAINGGFPAQYGGRLSSILDVKTRSSISRQTHASADIGLIASRVFIEQPLIKDKASVWIAARRTYIDRVAGLVGQNLPYHFYDVNGKFIFQPTPSDRVEISYYSGRDILDIFRDQNHDGNGFLTTYGSGNSSQAALWSHAFTSGWRSDLSFNRTAYRYRILNVFGENELLAFSNIRDYGGKLLFANDSVTHRVAMKTGVEWIHHNVSPNVVNSQGVVAEFLQSSTTSARVAEELAAFMQAEWPLTSRLRVNAGLRASMGMVKNRNYFFPEPRLSLRYALNHGQALKLSYSRMVQYMHRISNSAVSTPADLWYPVTDRITPQRSHQVSAAWQRFVSPKKIFLSTEVYYKAMDQLVGYQQGTNLFFNTDFESKLIQGQGRAYGLEVLVRKDAGRFTGWISYTLSWSWRRFDQMNNGEWFHARYDRRHNGAIVMQYALAKRWMVSAVWEFISGSRFTPVIGQYAVLSPTLSGFDLIPLYSGLNQVKLADTHRLDLGIKFLSRPERKFQWHWFVGVYNVYNRANPVGVFVEQNNDGSLHYVQPGLFGFLPFLSYGFKL